VWGLDRFDIYTANRDGSEIRRLTNYGVYTAEAILSPDGRRIVFTSLKDGDLDIYTMNVDGTDVRRLTTTVGYDGGPWWSPDGTKIVYRAWHPTDSTGLADYKRLLAQRMVRPSRMELWVMNADGSDQQPLTSRTSSLPDFAGEWSPDGARIMFARVVEEDPRGGSAELVDLYVINADGSGERRLAQDVVWSGTWSPDGRKIAFMRGSRSAVGIYVMNADGSGERKLTDGFGFAWSPDGQTIVFARDRAVWIMNADGSGQRRLTPAMGQIYDPVLAWSPSR
jgi:Tol biopolymer transport system component